MRGLPSVNRTKYKPTIYLLVETVLRPNLDQDEVSMESDLFQPYYKGKGRLLRANGRQWDKNMQILPIDQLIGPACVFPDLKNRHNLAFLHLKKRSEWAKDFGEWIMDKHTKEFSEPQSR